MEKMWHMPKAYTAFSSAESGGTEAVHTILSNATSHPADKHKGLPMETEVLQVCGKLGKAHRNVQSTSALLVLPAARISGSRLEVTCHCIASCQTHQDSSGVTKPIRQLRKMLPTNSAVFINSAYYPSPKAFPRTLSAEQETAWFSQAQRNPWAWQYLFPWIWFAPLPQMLTPGDPARTLSQAGHTPMCPVLQGAGLPLEAADIGYSLSVKAQAGRKGGARSTHSLMVQKHSSQL